MTEWIVSSALLIVVVAIVRQLLKGKISLQLQYALWAIVLLRLLVPVSFGQSKLSVQNVVQVGQTAQTEQGESAQAPGITIEIPPSRVDYVSPDLSVVEPDPTLPEAERQEQYEQNVQQWQDELDADWEKYKAENTRHVTLSVTDVLYLIWIAGMAVTAGIFVVSNLRFRLRLRRSRRPLEAVSRLPVYLTGAVETPCLFGLLRPAVYVTPEVAEDEVALGHVLAHEETHCRHGDHIWALLRCLCLVIHWYNPLVWLAAALSRRDAELACDAGTIRRIGEGERAAYGSTLIGLTCAHRSNLLHTATTMTGSKKSIKERILLIAKKPKMAVCTLIAVILIAAVAVGCTFTGAARLPLVSRLEKLEEESVNLMASQLDSKFYWLSEDEYGEVIEVLRGITEEQCLEKVEYPGEFSYSLRVYADGGGWDFRLVTSEKHGDGVIGLYDDSDEDYTKAYWLWIDSPELYQYIIELFNREKAEDPEPPAFVQVTAEHHVEQHRSEVEQKLVGVSVTHEILSELRGLTRLELGTAGLDYVMEMWRMDYDITVAFNRGQEVNTTAHTVYLVFLYDYINEQYTRFLGSVDDETLLNIYNIPEVIDQYGDMYRAAAMELYSQYAEASKQLNIPVSPSDGLYNLTKRGDTVSLTLQTKEGGEQRTFVLDYQSDSWKTTNLRTGVSWNLLSEAPEGDWDYWLTYTSEDGTVTVTFYAGENGPVCYRDEQRTIWWTERGGTPDAETLREEVYDPLNHGGDHLFQQVIDYAYEAFEDWLTLTDGWSMELSALELAFHPPMTGQDSAVCVYYASYTLDNPEASDLYDGYIERRGLYLIGIWEDLLSGKPVFTPLGYKDKISDLPYQMNIDSDLILAVAEEAISDYPGGSQNVSVDTTCTDIVFEAPNPVIAARRFAAEYAPNIVSLEPGAFYSVTDRTILEWELAQISTNRNLILMRFKVGFIPAGNLNNFAIGNLQAGEGGYEGWYIWEREAILELQDDGFWHCRAIGAELPNPNFYEGYNLDTQVISTGLNAAAHAENVTGYAFLDLYVVGDYSETNAVVFETGTTEEDRTYHFYILVLGAPLYHAPSIETLSMPAAHCTLYYGDPEEVVVAGEYQGEEWAYRIYGESAEIWTELLYRRAADNENQLQWTEKVEFIGLE